MYRLSDSLLRSTKFKSWALFFEWELRVTVFCFAVYKLRSNDGSILSAHLVLSEAARCIIMSAQHITIWQTVTATLLLMQSIHTCSLTFFFSPRHYV